MLRQGELLIHDGTPLHVTHPTNKARGAVPRDYSIQPREMFDPPSGAVIIPRTEWSERIADRIANQAQLSDIRLRGNSGQRIPSLDQGQVGYSHTADTEVLTEKGWVLWSDWNKMDLLGTVNPVTHKLEFQYATEWHAKEYQGETFHSSNRRLDFGVTNYHRMYVRKWDEARRTLSESYDFVNAKNLGWYSGFLAAPSGWLGTDLVELEVPGDRRYDGDDFLSLLALVVSDGYAGGSESTENLVSFCCFDERYDTVSALALRLGFSEQPSRKGVWNRWDAKKLAEWIRANCYTSNKIGAKNKRVPDLVKVASERQIKLFLGWYADKDKTREHYYSSSKRLIDDLQELMLRVGKRSTISNRGPREALEASTGKTFKSSECWELHVSTTNKLSLERKRSLETDKYNGLVYCATVPNGLLVTRRNGSVLISGNCWAHSTTHSVMISRAVANMPYIPLSAYAIAATIKQGRDEGGWGALSAEFAKTKGIPSQAFWPQGDRGYQKYQSNQEVWDNASTHRITEEWADLTKNVYDRNMTFDLIVSLLLTNVTGPADFNWWSHSVCPLDPVDGVSMRDSYRVESGKLASKVEFELHWGINDSVTGGIGIRIWNSWNDTWSDRGMGVLTGTKAIPDGAVSARFTTGS